MRQSLSPRRSNFFSRLGDTFSNASARNAFIGGVLIIALLAFELFNFDTTRYALNSLLGEVTFLNIGWATILAIAFCAIDFAGLAHMFTPENGREEPKEVWYLMGAWLLGATMNAVMTWWAISLTLLNHNLGNEILNREQLLQIVPIFVAVLVWLTRILFIGSLSIAGEYFFNLRHERGAESTSHNAHRTSKSKPTSRPRPKSTPPRTRRPAPVASFSAPTAESEAASFTEEPPVRQPIYNDTPPNRPNNSRVRRRPPVPNRPGLPVGMQAQPKQRQR